MKQLIEKAKVTGKRQITIPKRIYDYLDIKPGQQVVFEQKENEIIFSVEEVKEEIPCFACNNTGTLGSNPCFVCRGKGMLEKNISDDILKLLGWISMADRQYKFDICYSDIEKEIPKIILSSFIYSEEELIKIQDKLQLELVTYFDPKHKLSVEDATSLVSNNCKPLIESLYKRRD